jgi:hypothetical protein
MFMLSFLEIPKRVRKRLDFYCSRFFCQLYDDKEKYMLTKWNITCFLSKHMFKLLTEDDMRQQLLHNKYTKNKTFAQR